ncbi:MAG: cupredoxin domain-containing protein [Actinomycetota bacterium]
MRRSLVVMAAVLALGVVARISTAQEPPPARDVVHIRIENSRFDPATIEVKPGSTVRFVIENTDPIDHEFILGDQRLQDIHEAGTGHHHGEVPGEVSVPAGTTRSTTYTFEGPGALLFGCHAPGHWDYGMRGTVKIA